MGFDSIHGNDKPRSTIRHLEEEVARLQIELLHIKGQTTSVLDSADAAVERLTTCLAATIAEPRGRSHKQGSLIPLTSPFFLSGSPVPYLSSQAWEDTKSGQTQERSPRAINVSSIPSHVVDIMLKHYCEIYRPQYPAIEESDLHKACDRVHNNRQPSDYDIFCVHITLAISVCTRLSQSYMLLANIARRIHSCIATRKLLRQSLMDSGPQLCFIFVRSPWQVHGNDCKPYSFLLITVS